MFVMYFLQCYGSHGSMGIGSKKGNICYTKKNEQHFFNNGLKTLVTSSVMIMLIFIQEDETPGRKCGRIRVYTGPEMSTRQEMVPHITEAELEFNDVWMNERIGGGSYTFKKIIPRDPCE